MEMESMRNSFEFFIHTELIFIALYSSLKSLLKTILVEWNVFWYCCCEIPKNRKPSEWRGERLAVEVQVQITEPSS